MKPELHDWNGTRFRVHVGIFPAVGLIWRVSRYGDGCHPIYFTCILSLTHHPYTSHSPSLSLPTPLSLLYIYHPSPSLFSSHQWTITTTRHLYHHPYTSTTTSRARVFAAPNPPPTRHSAAVRSIPHGSPPPPPAPETTSLSLSLGLRNSMNYSVFLDYEGGPA